MKEMHRTLTLTILCVLICGLGCSSDKDPKYVFPSNPKPQDKFIKTELTGYPAGLAVYSFTEDLGDDKKCSGYLAIADFKTNNKLVFNTVHEDAAKTPSAIFGGFNAAGKGTPQIAVNGGYFWDGVSLSLLIADGTMKSKENQVVTRKDANGKDVSVYPLRAGFGRKADGACEAYWVYCVLDDDGKPYRFPSPLGNDERTKTYMAEPPTSKTDGAGLWAPQDAIGGGPMLVRNGANVAVDNYWKEVFDGGGIAGTSRQPRTAIGATADNKIILIVCDGRNMNGSSGYTLEELAQRLIWQGAVTALNLDGGGSSTFVGKDGKVLNRPSDTGTKDQIVERKVPTAVVISVK